MGSEPSEPLQNDESQQQNEKQQMQANQEEKTPNQGISASSILKQQLKMIESRHDKNVSSKVVQSKLNSLPNINKVSRSSQAQNGQIYLSSLKAKYVGQMVNEQPNGYGNLYFKNDDLLSGYFVKGNCNGKGRYIKADGSYYQGNISNNEADGHGKYESDTFKYEGQWKQNLPNGKGQALYSNGSRYRGQFLNGKKHGQGIFICDEGTYEGSFQNDLINGQCVFQGKEGDKYEGNWKNSVKQGHGIYVWQDGRKYQGAYKDDKREGEGVMIYGENQKYEGSWKNGLKHGIGSFYTGSEKLTGKWAQGKYKGAE